MTQYQSQGKSVAARSINLLFEGLESGHHIHNRHAPAPMTIWCHKPQRWTPEAAVLFVMHGVRRNARKYRNVWKKYAERHNFLLLVPEFSRQHYPNTRAYTLGACSASSARLSQNIPQTYHVIEQVFDAAKVHLSFRANTYFIYGHSAGAQFVHRFLLFLPDSRVEAAICANAGWYTMMSDAIRFPYGLKGS
jgi:poly(3-hydroxybutyrate) depolymerase